MDMMSQVTQFLEGLGGGLQNDQTLKLLIALLILIALLQNEQSQDQSMQDAFEALGQASVNAAAGSIFVSSTSVEIQQTTTTISYSSTDLSAQFGGGEGSTGGNVDLVA